jgi:hypothetical protein
VLYIYILILFSFTFFILPFLKITIKFVGAHMRDPYGAHSFLVPLFDINGHGFYI